ncbi:MAG: hypothetical protein Q7V57_09560 [Actinomycetota bacterium]|nr:hypothetical protein [Actinomycetota bacterium]
MIRTQLNSYSGNDPIWGFVALVGSERFTGEAAVGLAPRIHLYAMEGRVYYAERDGDAPIGDRLVQCAAITAAQLEQGSVRLGEVASLARLFQRVPMLDRDAVELTIELATEALLESVANHPVGMPEVFPLRHHSSGVHHWLRSAAASNPVPVERVAQAAPETVAQVGPDLETVAQIEPVAEPVEPVLVPTLAAPPDPEPAPEPEPLLPAAIEPQPEPVTDEPEPDAFEDLLEPVWAPEPQPTVEPVALDDITEPIAIEPAEPEAEPEPEPEPAAFVPLSLTPLAVAGASDPIPEPIPEPTFEPTFEPLPTLGAMPQTTPAAIPTIAHTPAPTPPPPSFDQLDAVLAATPPAPGSTPFEPTDNAFDDLQLADLPPISSLAFLTGVDAPTGTTTETITGLPELMALGSPSQHQPFVPAAHDAMQPGPAPAGLPKLATAPVAVGDLDLDPAHMVGAARTGASPTHTLAAVDIWELVDEIMVEAPPAQPATVGDDEDERRGRGRRRGRKS